MRFTGTPAPVFGLFWCIATVSAAPAATTVPKGKTACPAGSTWQQVDETFSNLNSSRWTVDTGSDGAKFGKGGATFTVTQQRPSVVLVSKASWVAPVTVSFDIKTSDASGIARAFFFGALDGGEEIDLEICKNQFQLPIWKRGAGQSQRITKSSDGSKEVTQHLYAGTHENKDLIDSYGYRYHGYDPTQWTSYKLNWQPTAITWNIGGSERVKFTKNTALPSTPLPIRLGPWFSGEGRTWCGDTSWQKYPSSTMQVRKLVIEGCMVG